MVDWYDVVKWSNARSRLAGLTPVYYTDAGLTQVYTNGETTNVFANWTANGYRLPTEAEWEKAARGGLIGQRFPWGNTISESQANYDGKPTVFAFDLGPAGYNTIGQIGGIPYTTPVGTFAANGYGLYDMAGNVQEWCWDWYGTPYAGGTDPRGPASNPGNMRVIRGGLWSLFATVCRCANRSSVSPSEADTSTGFRCVMGL
jgi:formylglycine-generating enzyme required for sulfatase activity